ncbi:MAG: flippase, partial [Candidatus Nanohaloarchaea archaeon]
EEAKHSALKIIFAGGSIMFFATFIAKFLALIYRLMTGRLLGPIDYGVITLMMTIYSTVTTFAFLSIPQGVQKYVSDYRGKKNYQRVKGTVRSGLLMVLATSTFIGLILFMSSRFLAVQIFNEELAIWPIRFVAISLPFLGATKVLTNVAEGYEEMKPTAYTGEISVNLIKVVLTALLIYLSFGYLGAAFAFSFSIICGGGIAYYFYKKIIPAKVEEAKPSHNYKEIVVFSLPLIAGGMFGVISGQIDTYMLQYFLGTKQVGLYNAAYPFALLISSFSGIFSSVFMSAASRLNSEGKGKINAEIFRTLTKWISALGVPIFLILFFFPKTALFLFGKEYYSAAPVLRILSIGFLLSSITGPVQNIYQAYDRTELNFYTSAVLAISNLILNYLFIVVLSQGILGAALATTISFAITAIFNIVMSYKFLGKNPFKLATFKTWFFGIISILMPYTISNYFFKITPSWFFLIDLALFSGLYFLLLGFTRTLETEDKVIIEGILTKVGLSKELASILKYSK